jgi:hypothetical protein
MGPNTLFLGHIAQTVINQRLAQYFYFSSKVSHRSIAHIPTEYRRNATGVSPKSRCNIAEKAAEYRRKANTKSPKSHSNQLQTVVQSRF